MSNRILGVSITDDRLDPYEAELGISLAVEQVTPSTQVRGRLMGPRYLISSTVEVAYPVRDMTGRSGRSTNEAALRARVIIPEPSFWEPDNPFLYQGPIELWEDHIRLDEIQVSHGLRVIRAGPK